MGRRDQLQGAFKWTLMAVVILTVMMLAGVAVAATTWTGPGSGSTGTTRLGVNPDTANNGPDGTGASPKTCTVPSGATTCTSGGSFLDGNPSFAAAGTTANQHNLYAVWASDRWSGNDSLPLVPYSNACGVSSNPGRNNAITTLTRVDPTSQTSAVVNTGVATHRAAIVSATAGATGTIDAIALSDPLVPESQNPTGGISTYDQVLVAGVVVDPASTPVSAIAPQSGTTYRYTSTAHGLAVGDMVRVDGVSPTAYNGEFEVTNVSDANNFDVNVGSIPGGATVTGAAATKLGRKATLTSITGNVGTITYKGATNYFAGGNTVNLVGFDSDWNGGYTVISAAGAAGAWTITVDLSSGGSPAIAGLAQRVTGASSSIGYVQKGATQFNGRNKRVSDGNVPTYVQFFNGTNGGQTGYGGSLWSAEGTFPATGHPFNRGDAVIVTQNSGAGAGWLSPVGTGTYDAWTVQSVPGPNSFTANVGWTPGAPWASGTANVLRSVVTVNTTDPHGLVAGQSKAVVTGFPSAQGKNKYNGTWPVTEVVNASSFKFTFDQNIPAGSNPPGTSGEGAVGRTPYCEGVYFTKSTNEGPWATPTQMNVGTPDGAELAAQHNEFYAVGADGTNIAVVFAPTSGYYSQMCPISPRPGYLTVSSDSGNTWSTPVRFTGLTDRIGYPNIAVAGNEVYIASSATPAEVDPVSAPGGQPPLAPVYVWHTTISPGPPATVGTFNARIPGYTRSTYEWGSAPGGCSSTLAGYDPQPGITANGNHVGIMWAVDNTGKANIKVSSDKGATWSLGCGAGGTAATCTQRFPAGVKGYIFSQSAQGCAEWQAGNALASGACALANISADSVPNASDGQTTFGFAWISADNLPSGEGGYTTATASGGWAPPGVYTKTWSATGGWGPTIRISCFTTQNLGGGAGNCSTAPAPQVYGYGYGVSIDAHGDPNGVSNGPGYAVTWTACYLMSPGPDCAQNAKDSGSDILLKESGNAGLGWGGDWGVASSYTAVATIGGGANFTINEYPGVVYDDPSENYSGCKLTAGGATEAGCKKYVGYLSRDKGYYFYQLFMARGTT